MKEKIFKKGIRKRLFSIVLALTMVLGLMTWIPLSVQAIEGYSEARIGGEEYMYKTLMYLPLTDTSLVCSEHGQIATRSDSNADFHIDNKDNFSKCKNAGHIGKKITVSFNMHGHGTQLENRDYPDGYVMGIPVVDNDGDWIFDGWYTDENFIRKWGINDEVYLGLTLHANWIQISHTWTYSVGQGANSNKLIATCGGTSCASSPHNVSLTLTATSANYSGSAVTYSDDGTDADIKLTGKTDWTTAGLAYEVKYYTAYTDETTNTLTSSENSGASSDGAAPVNAGSYVVVLKAKEGETVKQTLSKTFSINATTITSDFIDLGDISVEHTGSPITKTVSVKNGSTVLVADTDYTLTGDTTGTNKGQYTVTVTGKGNYTGTATKTWNIVGAIPTITTQPTVGAITYGQKLSDSTLTGGVAQKNSINVPGTFAWKTPNTVPQVSDSQATTYKIVFTPTNTESYGPVEYDATVTVNQKALTADGITVTAPNATGSDLTNSVVVKFGGTTLVKDTDYTITFDPNPVKDEGKYTAKITFKGNYSGTDIQKEFTVSKRSSGGGGGGSSTPTTNATIGGETGSTTNVSVSTSGGQATVSDIPKNTVDSIANSNANGGDIVLDVSKAGNSQVTKVTLTKNTVENISKALDSGDNNKTNLVVKTGNAEVTFDAAAVKAIAEQASAGSIQIVVENTTGANLNNSQKKVVEDLGKGNSNKEAVQTFEASIISGGRKISNFMGGNVTVAQINFTVPAGKKAANYHIYYIPTSGAAERCNTWVKDGRIYFVTGHFSDYVIVYDEAVSNGEGIPVYRLYHNKLGDHLFTTSVAERDAAQKIGYKLEGVGFYASGTGNKVYRLCNPRSGEHFYTTSETEKNACVAADWRLEGIAFTTEGEKKVYRLYNGKVHFYTTSEKEKEFCLAHGWKLEGVGFTAN